MKKQFSLLAFVVMTLSVFAFALPLGAGEPKPVVTVSFAGYDELMSDVELIGKLGGKPGLVKMLDGMIAMMTQGKGLSALDQKQPIGAVLLVGDNGQFQSYGFVPVSDLPKLLESLPPSGGEGPKAENGVYEIPLGMQTVFATQKGKWTYLSEKKDALDNASGDPSALLGDLPKKYLLAVRASIKNIPVAMRQQYLGLLQMTMQMSAQRQDNESDEQFAARSAMTKQNVEQIKMMAEELDEVLVGVNIDRSTNKAVLDFEFTAKAGTPLAAKFSAVKPGDSAFAGLKLPDAAITFNAVGTYSDDDIAKAKNSINAVRVSVREELKKQQLPKEKLDLALQAIDDLFAVITKTIEGKRMDCGLALVLDPEAVTVVGGGLVADTNTLQKMLN
ncbi:MAG: hypothetical protein ACWGMZ_11030, partial [Thermoguttaceae bacterium]